MHLDNHDTNATGFTLFKSVSWTCTPFGFEEDSDAQPQHMTTDTDV